MFCACVIVLVLALFIYDWYKRLPWVSDLAKKCVFITGCDSGFGNALARSLYSRGVYVFAGCYTESGACSLREATGDRLKTLLVDVSKTDSVLQAAKYVEDNLPPNTALWGIVNNAGILGAWCPVEFLRRSDIQAVLDVNLLGMIDVVNAFLPMLKKSRGRIVNMSSMAGEVSFPSIFPYLVSKAGGLHFSEGLRREKIVWGIKVSTILPGAFSTTIIGDNGIKKTLEPIWSRQSEDIKQEYGRDWLEKHLKDVSKRMSETTPDLSPVIRSYEHALFARHPCKKYYPGLQSKITPFLNRYMPWMLDFIMNNRAPVPLPDILK